MADFGDWGRTEASVRTKLESFCLRPLCGHIRWAHGTMWWAATNVSTITHNEGKCSIANCPCSEFTTVAPISEDDVYAVVELLRPTSVTLEDLGIGSLSSLQCSVLISRHIAGESFMRQCLKDAGHKGDHDW